MLKFWRSYSAHIVWIFCGISFVVGIFVLHPVYINICETAQNGAPQKCEPNDILYVAFLKFAEIITSAEFWTALATVAIAAFTWTLKKSTDNLWRVTNDTLRHSEQTAERQLRAYVGFENGTVFLNKPSNGQITAYMIFKNYGATPAYQFKSWTNMNITSAETPPYKIRGVGDTLTIVNPGAAIYGTNRLPISNEELLDIVAGRKKIYVWGHLEYVDIFGEKRFVEFFRAMFAQFGKVTFEHIAGEGWSFRPDPRGDEAN